jgi:hypothetical protein
MLFCSSLLFGQGTEQQKPAMEIETRRADNDLFESLAKLPEFLNERKRIDSLRRATKEDIKLHVDYNESPYLEEGERRNLSMTILFEQMPGRDLKILFTIMFDKDSRKIVSVEDHIRKTRSARNFTIDWKQLSDLL